MKNILVLGGSGFIGAHVCEKLVRLGLNVTVPTRRRNNARNVMHLPSLTVLELDVHDELALSNAVAGHDAVVNLVAVLHGNQARFERVHVALVQKIVNACLIRGVKQLVHISALGVNGNNPDAAPSMYLRSKGRGEKALELAVQAGLDVTVLRPSVVFGQGDKFLNLFASLQKIFPVMPLAGASARFQPVWVEDVASAVVSSLGKSAITSEPLRVFEACGPEVFTLQQLVELSAKLAGVNEGRGRPVIALPDWAGNAQAAFMEHLPGEPVMSRDNMASMKVPNIATPGMPGLAQLGIAPSALQPIAQDYLTQGQATHGLLGVRKHAH
jgi:NADH dehydrogenase